MLQTSFLFRTEKTILLFFSLKSRVNFASNVKFNDFPMF